MSDDNPTPAGSRMPDLPKSGRGVQIALAISLAVNLAIAGMVAGAMLRSSSDGARESQVREMGFGPFTEALSRADRATLRQAFLAKSPGSRQIKRQRRDDAMAVLDALRMVPFAPETLSAVMAAQQDRTARQLILGQEVLRDFLIAMPPADRAGFANRLEERLRVQKDKDTPREKSGAPQP